MSENTDQKNSWSVPYYSFPDQTVVDRSVEPRLKILNYPLVYICACVPHLHPTVAGKGSINPVNPKSDSASSEDRWMDGCK